MQTKNVPLPLKTYVAVSLLAEGKYLPPALRAAAAAAAGGGGDEERLVRRVRGLLNRMTESSLPKVAAEVVALFPTEGRRTVCHAVNAELLAVRPYNLRAMRTPRFNLQY